MDVRATAQRTVSEAGGAEGAVPGADFERVYAEHFAFVWRNLRRLGVAPAQLDDAAQEVFIVVHRRLAEVRVEALRPFLFGVVRSRQFGHGYVIGPAPSLQLETSLGGLDAQGTEPEDWVEGPGEVGALEPASLYEDQLARRLGR